MVLWISGRMADSQPQGEESGVNGDKSFEGWIKLREENNRSLIAMLEDLTQEMGTFAARVAQLEQSREGPDSNLVSTPAVNMTPSVLQSSGILKPRDIPILTLNALQGLESPARLQMFVEGVERCVSDEQARIEIAKSRMDSDLALFIHTAQRSRRVRNWEEVVEYLQEEFNVKINFDQAWRVHEDQQYDWRENPHTYIQSFKCKYAILQSRFVGEKLPSRDTLIKKKLSQGFPQHSREKLEMFLDREIPLSTFIERVEHERLVLSHQQNLTQPVVWNRLSTSEVGRNRLEYPLTTTSSPPDPVVESIERLKQSVESLSHKLEVLEAKASVTKYQSSPRYSVFCKTTGHEVRDCRRKPRLGRCFDCDRPNCRRGNPDCPGTSEMNRKKTRTTQVAEAREDR